MEETGQIILHYGKLCQIKKQRETEYQQGKLSLTTESYARLN